jgi:hypothetical protein
LLEHTPLLIHTLVALIEQVNNLVGIVPQIDPPSMPFGLDLSIESLRARKFSIGIFAFLIVSLFIFAVIIYVYLPKGGKRLKRGEKIMFGAMIVGMVLAVLVGYLQLVDGYLL